MKIVPFAKVGVSKALAAGWIEIDKNNKSLIKKKVSSIIDVAQNHLMNIIDVPDNVKQDYKKRKLLQQMYV